VETRNLLLTPKVRRLASGNALAALLLSLILMYPAISEGSDLFALSGPSTAGGSLLARNHEGEPVYHDELRLVIPEQGHTYLGLFSFHKDSVVAFVAGINEKGLAAATGKAQPGTVHTSGPGRMDHLPGKLLSSFDSVEHVMRNQEIFRGTGHILYLIADRERAVTVERTPEGRLSVRASAEGFLSGTALLNNLMAIQTEGEGFPPGWLWKAEVDRSGLRTLSRWIVSLPAKGPPELLLKVLNPDDPSNPFTINLLLDHEFWTAGID
jgi:hypothetical protein